MDCYGSEEPVNQFPSVNTPSFEANNYETRESDRLSSALGEAYNTLNAGEW